MPSRPGRRRRVERAARHTSEVNSWEQRRPLLRTLYRLRRGRCGSLWVVGIRLREHDPSRSPPSIACSHMGSGIPAAVPKILSQTISRSLASVGPCVSLIEGHYKRNLRLRDRVRKNNRMNGASWVRAVSRFRYLADECAVVLACRPQGRLSGIVGYLHKACISFTSNRLSQRRLFRCMIEGVGIVQVSGNGLLQSKRRYGVR